MIKVRSKVRISRDVLNELTDASTRALVQTAEFIHTEVVQAQVVPFNTGNLQNENMFVDESKSKNGKVTLVNSTPYARRLYFHPEYKFRKHENPNAKGKWYKDWAVPPDGTGKYSEEIKNAFKKFYRKEAGL